MIDQEIDQHEEYAQEIINPVECDLYEFYRIKLSMMMALMSKEYRLRNKMIEVLAWMCAFAFCIKRNPKHEELLQFLTRNNIVETRKDFRNAKYTLKQRQWITTSEGKEKEIIIAPSVFDLENAIENPNPRPFSSTVQMNCSCDEQLPQAFKMTVKLDSKKGYFKENQIEKKIKDEINVDED